MNDNNLRILMTVSTRTENDAHTHAQPTLTLKCSFFFFMSLGVLRPVQSVNSIRLDLRSWIEVEEYLKNCKAIILPMKIY